MQQDFECGSNSHAVPSNSTCTGSGLPPNQGYDASTNPTVFESVHAHSGVNGWGSLLSGDGQQSDWYFNTLGNDPNLASYTSLYVSYWDWTDSNAMLANSDYFEGGINISNACGDGFDNEFYGNPALASMTSGGTMIAAGTGDPTPGCVGVLFGNQAFTITINAGRWEQHEFQITPSTVYTAPVMFPPPNCNNLSPSATGCGNGAIALWFDGQTKINIQNGNLNGSVSMLNKVVLVGGIITSFATGGDQGTGGLRCPGFGTNGTPTTSSTNASPSQCNGTQPGTGAPQPFHRYFDDIIILKR